MSCRKVLGIAGVKDVWSSMQGGKNVYNMASATMKALDGLNLLKPKLNETGDHDENRGSCV